MKWMIGIASFLLVLTGLFSEGYAFPTKSIKAIIGYEAGSSSDIAGRTFLQHAEKELGQPIMIINKPGAASALALRELLDSKADGYTIALSCSVNVLKIQGLLPQTHWDFDVLGVPSLTWSVLAVSAKTPFKSTKELIEHAKANPGKLRMSTTAKGAVYWIQANYFERVAGAKFNIISNPGGASYIATQLGGAHADVGIASYKALQSQIEAGNVRVLGITTAARIEGFANLPTLKEQGYDMVMNSWVAHLAPKGLPAEVSKKLLSTYSKASSTREWKEWCTAKGSIPSPEYVGKAAAKFLDQDAEIQRPILESIKGK
jgi:tripartite-type tricarboxylate transporter receptor subunit TctC